MDPNLGKLAEVAQKVRTPLALSGLALIILYGIYKAVLSLNVFANVGSAATFLLLQNVIDKVFWLALIALILGVLSYLTTILLRQKERTASASHVTLIDASLDPHDSPYKETKEDGVRKIRYTGEEP